MYLAQSRGWDPLLYWPPPHSLREHGLLLCPRKATVDVVIDGKAREEEKTKNSRY